MTYAQSCWPFISRRLRQRVIQVLRTHDVCLTLTVTPNSESGRRTVDLHVRCRETSKPATSCGKCHWSNEPRPLRLGPICRPQLPSRFGGQKSALFLLLHVIGGMKNEAILYSLQTAHRLRPTARTRFLSTSAFADYVGLSSSLTSRSLQARC